MHFLTFTFNAIAAAIAAVWAVRTRDYEPFVTLIALLGSLPFSFIAALKHPPLDRLQRRRHTSLRIATVGGVAVGKTVYLTVVLKCLLEAQITGRRFRLVENEAIKVLFSYIKDLQRGQWPPRTTTDSKTDFAGMLEENRHFRLHSTKLLFSDESGEKFNDLRNADDGWLHDTEYFRYVCSADVVLVLFDSTRQDFERYTAAMHVLANASLSDGVYYAPKVIAIIFTKADKLCSEAERNTLLENAKPLLTAASNLFAASRYFFVSSTGPGSGDAPPIPLSPTNVLNPIHWAISARPRAQERKASDD